MRGTCDALFLGRRRHRRLTPLLALPLLALAALRPVAQEPLTLSGALATAARNSLEARTATLDLAAAREESLQVKALYYPTLQLSGGHMNLDNDPAFKFGPMIFPAGDQVYWQVDLALRETLWDGGRRSTALSASRLRESAVELGGGAAVKKLQAEVAARYVAAMTLKDQRAVVEQRHRALEDHLRIVQDLYDQGVVARNDLLRTEVTLRSVGDQATALDSALASSVEELNRAMGLAPRAQTLLPDAMAPPPVIPWDEDTCLRRAADSNEGVRAMAARTDALKRSVDLRKKDYAPIAVAELGHGYEQNRYMAYPHVNRLFVGLAWNLYDGGVRASRIRQAQAEADASATELEDARRKAEVAASAALRDYREALKETATARLNVTSAEENLRIVEDQYKEGLARTTDVLDAESILAESRFSEVKTYYQAYARQAALLAAMGEDLAAFYGGAPNASSTGKEN